VKLFGYVSNFLIYDGTRWHNVSLKRNRGKKFELRKKIKHG